MRKPTRREFGWMLIGAALLIALMIVFAMAGCAVGRELESGSPMVGLQLGDPAVIQAASGIGGVVGGLFGGPAGAATGTALFGGLATLIWGSRQKAVGRIHGEERGWNDAQTTFAPPPGTIVVPAGGIATVPDRVAVADSVAKAS